MKRMGALLYLLVISLFAMIGCDEPKPQPQATSGSGSAAPPAPTPGKELNLFAWSEYVPQAVIDGFTKETKIKVNYETYASNEEMLGKLLAGSTKYDLIQPSEYVIEALVKKGKLEQIDASKVPNLKNIGSEYRGLPHDPELKYSVPYMSGTVGIVVNTDKIKDPIKSYKDVFQAKYKGRIVSLDDNLELVTWALAAEGMDSNEITTEALEKIKPTLAAWIKLVKVFDSDSPKTALLNGDVDLGVVWNGEAAKLLETDKKFQFAIPEEGVHMNVDSLAIPKGAPNKLGAEMFMNYVLKPEVSKLISDEFPYTNPNMEARKLLKPEQLKNPASYPTVKKKATFRDIGKMAAEVDKLVTDLKAAN